jgi:Polyketide cyclase / dehydrase and lipid transport
MIKSISLLVLALIVGVLGYAVTKPDSFRVQRNATIKAPAEKIFPLINDFKQWAAWSPWEKRDPAMKRTHSGAPAGKGAAYAWEGNSEVGAGRMEIIESNPTSKVGIKLDFIKPFEGHNTAEFTLDPKGDATNVTWSMFGPSPFMMKVMSIFMNMDSMIGKDFEAGLANLKSAAEK